MVWQQESEGQRSLTHPYETLDITRSAIDRTHNDVNATENTEISGVCPA